MTSESKSDEARRVARAATAGPWAHEWVSIESLAAEIDSLQAEVAAKDARIADLVAEAAEKGEALCRIRRALGGYLRPTQTPEPERNGRYQKIVDYADGAVAEIGRLRDGIASVVRSNVEFYRETQKQLATRDATIARLVEALEPFAGAAWRFDEPSSGPLQWSDSNGFSTSVRLTVGQLRHARAALAAARGEG